VIDLHARSREGWFRNRILTRLAWEPPLARSLRARAALLTQEGGPPRSDGFSANPFTASRLQLESSTFLRGLCPGGQVWARCAAQSR